MMQSISDEEMHERVKNKSWWAQRRVEMDSASYLFVQGLAKYYLAPQALGRNGNSGKPLAPTYVNALVEGVASFYRWTRAVTEAQRSESTTETFELTDILRLINIPEVFEECFHVYPLAIMFLGIPQNNPSEVVPAKASGTLHKLLALFHGTKYVY